MARVASTGRLVIQIAAQPCARIEALEQVLAHRGHAFTCVAGMREILETGVDSADALIIDGAGTGGADAAWSLLSDLQRAGVTLPIVLIARRPSFDTYKRATELGATAVVPSAFDPRGLIDAIEAIHPADAIPTLDPHTLRTEHTLAPGESERALEHVERFLASSGVAAPHRVRVLCAVYELIDNVERHAFATGAHGDFHVEATLRRTRVAITVRDTGCGFDSISERLECVPAALPRPTLQLVDDAPRKSERGFVRVSRLSEALIIHSDARGTTVDVEFELTPVRTVGEALPALDALHPRRIASVVARILDGESEIDAQHAALEATLRRLVGRPTVLNAIEQG